MAHYAQLDTRIEIVTPENIAFQHRLAGPFRRALAYLIDFVIRAAVVIVLFVVLMLFGAVTGVAGITIGAWLAIYFVLDWFYGGFFESLWNGRTPGKWCLKLRVVSTAGQPITVWQAVLRNVLRTADAMPAVQLYLLEMYIPTFQLAVLAMMFNRRFQRFGDLICGTMVVVEEPQRLYGVALVSDPAALALAAELPARFEASRNLARALSAYVQRRLTLGGPRRAEIARHLGEPLRVRFGLPYGTSHDLLLCALYHRVFVADAGEAGLTSPFRQPQAWSPQPRPAKPAELAVPRSMAMRSEEVEGEALVGVSEADGNGPSP